MNEITLIQKPSVPLGKALKQVKVLVEAVFHVCSKCICSTTQASLIKRICIPWQQRSFQICIAFFKEHSVMLGLETEPRWCRNRALVAPDRT